MQEKIRIIRNLGEYTAAIAEIAKGIIGEEKGKQVHSIQPPILWFRGVSHVNHCLIPSLFRTQTRVTSNNGKGDYSDLHYAEDIRSQHYAAKNQHYLKTEPSSRVEWLEIMQHHGSKTRVLDWSESSIHSLIFAVEAFLDNHRFNEKARTDCIPCIWVLNPQRLNKNIFGHLKNDWKLILELVDELELNVIQRREALNIIDQYFHTIGYKETKDVRHLDYILNLSSINDEILRDRSRLKKLLVQGDIINPIYYLLSRIYSDGHILKDRVLPPLAVVQPYHSERIKAQKGVFTVFPFYQEKEEDSIVRDMGLNPDAMENNLLAAKCLYKLVLDNPQNIAYELLANGISDSWLYPELPIISNEIENRMVY